MPGENEGTVVAMNKSSTRCGVELFSNDILFDR